MRVPGLRFSVDADDVPWRSTRTPGVAWFPVHGGDGKRPGDAAVLIRMEPGCGYPPHRHLGVEEVLVLQGGYRDEFGTHESGDYVRYEAGSVHAPVALGEPHGSGADQPSCLLYAIARGGTEVLAASGRAEA